MKFVPEDARARSAFTHEAIRAYGILTGTIVAGRDPAREELIEAANQLAAAIETWRGEIATSGEAVYGQSEGRKCLTMIRSEPLTFVQGPKRPDGRIPVAQQPGDWTTRRTFLINPPSDSQAS